MVSLLVGVLGMRSRVSCRSASTDNIRLWNVAEAGEPDHYGKVKSGVQFKIIPGHHGGYVSQMRKYMGIYPCIESY